MGYPPAHAPKEVFALNRTLIATGLNVCIAMFVALSAYGIFLYMDWANPPKGMPPLAWAACAVFLAGSLAGIVYFGSRLDRLNRDEERRACPGAGEAPDSFGPPTSGRKSASGDERGRPRGGRRSDSR